MIYEFPDSSEPVRQGDIFVGLPRIEISLDTVILVDESGEREAKWSEIAQQDEDVKIIVAARPVTAIVATQDCDAVRHDITLCEIQPFPEVEGKAKQTNSPKSWKNMLTQQARLNQKWFYLPPDNRIGFPHKMAVDFRITLRVPATELENLRALRKGRLNAMADEHFRERISEFFRRYPYDEWYPLNAEELKAYINEYPGTEPYPWQNGSATVGAVSSSTEDQ